MVIRRFTRGKGQSGNICRHLTNNPWTPHKGSAESPRRICGSGDFLANAIKTHRQGSSSMRLHLATRGNRWSSLQLVSMVMVSDSQPAILFHLWKSETTLRLQLLTWEYLSLFCVVSTYIVLQDQQIVVCALRRSCTVTEQTFCRHGMDDTRLTVQQFTGIHNRIPLN